MGCRNFEGGDRIRDSRARNANRQSSIRKSPIVNRQSGNCQSSIGNRQCHVATGAPATWCRRASRSASVFRAVSHSASDALDAPRRPPRPTAPCGSRACGSSRTAPRRRTDRAVESCGNVGSAAAKLLTSTGSSPDSVAFRYRIVPSGASGRPPRCTRSRPIARVRIAAVLAPRVMSSERKLDRHAEVQANAAHGVGEVVEACTSDRTRRPTRR